MKSLKDQDKNA